VAFIRASQTVGIPLSVIGGVLGFLPEGVSATRELWINASVCWSEEINARIEKMERMRERFTECIGCGCLSFEQCALVNPGDTLAEHGPGPRRLLEP
jgi:MerR family redox-sensitive transcriptional activator SoxR